MDQNEFFRQATLRICGNLEIEEALHASLKFLTQEIPIDRIFLQCFDEKADAMRTIAMATESEGSKLDLLTPLSDEAKAYLASQNLVGDDDIFIFKDPQQYAISREMLSYHNLSCKSLIVLTLRSKSTVLGSAVFISETEMLDDRHSQLISLLKEPFVIALSNTLEHRSELKLFDRDFFWEMTKRICGNLEIEEGLRSCIEYLSKFIPADTIYLEKYDDNFGSVRCFARATPEKGEKIDIMIPLLEEARAGILDVIKGVKQGKLPTVFVNNKPQEIPFSKLVLQSLGEPSSSILSLTLIIGDEIAGALTLLAKGDDRYDEKHAKLFATLRMPFFVAMSNTIKHREILKLKEMLADDNRYLHNELRRISGDEIIGANFGLNEVMVKVNQVAPIDSPVLLLGETGVGKDVIANAIHYSSSRNNGPFVSVNCGAIPDTLIDSELFGHEKGAFTGALARKRGRFERAHKGTIFLDEIGELPLQAQVRLLKVLQTKEIERVGGVDSIRLDIRVIAATNRNLKEMIEKGLFREDLWFRLNVFPIMIPPLRERRPDIPALVQHFINIKSKELKLQAIPDISPGAMDDLMNYPWPGNVRELQNVVERELILNPQGPLTFKSILPVTGKSKEILSGDTPGNEHLDTIVADHIRRILTKTDGKIHGPGGAAEVLGINASTLRNRMNKLGIEYRKQSQV